MSAEASAAGPDFIEIYPDAVPRPLCADWVAQFEASRAAVPGRVGGGVHPELKDSDDIEISGRPEWQQTEAMLNQAVFAALARYIRAYPYSIIAPLAVELADAATGQRRRIDADGLRALPDEQLAAIMRLTLRPGLINLQRYRADRGGYPYWHCELYPRDPNCEQLHRHVLWTLYLNDGFEAGETEFLYQRRRIVPRAGTLLIAPAAFTHTHRGNTPRGGDKYIATSWVLFQRAERLYPPAA